MHVRTSLSHSAHDRLQIGLDFQLNSSADGSACVVVVASSFQAEEAGIHRGDAITAVDGTPVNTPGEAADAIFNAAVCKATLALHRLPPSPSRSHDLVSASYSPNSHLQR